MNAIPVNAENPTVEERSALITLGGQQYELVLSTLATKQIAKRYGGLENLGEKLSKTEHFEEALDEIIYLITLLANQSVMIHNLWHPDDKRDLLTEETVDTKTRSSLRCTKAPNGMCRVRRATQKTRKQPGKRRRILRPAAVLRREPAAPSGTGGLAHAVRRASGSVGDIPSVQRSVETAARRDDRRRDPGRNLKISAWRSCGCPFGVILKAR